MVKAPSSPLEPGARPAPPLDLSGGAVDRDRLRLLEAENAELKRRIAYLLDHAGEPGRCRACGAPIVWFRHRSGAGAPYSMSGLSHFADCPKADQFRRRRSGQNENSFPRGGGRAEASAAAIPSVGIAEEPGA